MPDPTPGNSAKLQAIIEFTAVLDKSSFAGIKKELDELNGTGGAKKPDDEDSDKSSPNAPTSPDGAPKKEGLGAAATGVIDTIKNPMDGGKKEAGGEGGGMGAGLMMGVAAGMKVIEGGMQLLSKMAQIIIDSSPLLQSSLKLFSTSMKLLFMPLGNMIGKILMPIMIKYLQKSADRLSKLKGDESIETLTSGAIEDMMGALFDVMGAILTKVMPGLLTGLVQGIGAAIGNLFGGNNNVSAGFDSAISEYEEKFSSSGLALTKFSAGTASALDRFGWVMNTSNNNIGKATSDLATTFYTSQTTIENGFNETATTYTTGTTKMITYLNDSFNLVAAGANLVYDTITGQVSVFGTKIDGVYNSFINPILTKTTEMNGALGGLTTWVININTELSTLVDTVRKTVDAISETLRDQNIEQPEKIKYGDDNLLKYSTIAAWGGKENIASKGISAEEAVSMGASEQDVNSNQTYYMRQAGGRFIITDFDGNIKKQGIYNMDEFKKLVTKKSLINSGGMSAEGAMRIKSGNVFGNTDTNEILNMAYGSGNQDHLKWAKNISDINTNPKNNSNTPTKNATGKITNGPENAIIGEAGREAVVPIPDEMFTKYSNDEIYSRLSGALTPGVSNLKQKIDGASGSYDLYKNISNSNDKTYNSTINNNKTDATKINNTSNSTNTTNKTNNNNINNSKIQNDLTKLSTIYNNKTDESINTTNKNIYTETPTTNSIINNSSTTESDSSSGLSNYYGLNTKDTEKEVDRFSNDTILSGVKNANQSIQAIDTKIETVTTAANATAKNKQSSANATINLTISGNVYGVDDLKATIKQAFDEYAYQFKGAY